MTALERLREIHIRGPVKSIDHHPLASFNKWLAVSITSVVGTMWCAYLFAALSVLGNPLWAPLWLQQIVTWVSQNFLQLILLSIIMVGQSVLSIAADARASQDHEILGHTIEILDGQNKELTLQTQILKLLEDNLIPKDGTDVSLIKPGRS